MKKALTLILVLMLPAVAFGDLLIVEKVSSSGAMGMWESHGTETTYIKGEKVRTDSEMKVKGFLGHIHPRLDGIREFHPLRKHPVVHEDKPSAHHGLQRGTHHGPGVTAKPP